MSLYDQLKALESKFYTTAEVAEKLDISERAVRHAIEADRLPAINFKGRWLIACHVLEDTPLLVFDENELPSFRRMARR